MELPPEVKNMYETEAESVEVPPIFTDPAVVLETPKKKYKKVPASGLKELGRSFLSTLRSCANDRSTKGPVGVVKHFATEVVGNMGPSAFAPFKKLLRGVVFKKRLARKTMTAFDVRKCIKHGSRKATVDDKDIIAALELQCRSSSSFCRRHQKSFGVLTSSLRRAWRASATIRGKIGYKQLARRVRLHNPRLPITKARKRVDICNVCRCWDVKVVNEIGKTIKDCIELVQRTKADYFDGFREVETRYGWCNEGVSPFEDWRYPMELQKYIQGRAEPSEGSDLHVNEAVALVTLKEVEEEVRPYYVHWQLRDYLDNALLKDVLKPTAGKIYLLSDWKEFHCF